MHTGRKLVVETNLRGRAFQKVYIQAYDLYIWPECCIVPKTYEIFVISLQCLLTVIFHDIFFRVLRFCIKYKRFFSIIHTPIWKLS